MAKKDHLRGNKIAAGVLIAGLLVFGINYIGEAVYDLDRIPETAGYAIDGGAELASVSAVDAVLAPISPLLQEASLDKGLQVFKKCQTCHSVDKGGPHRVGPNLYNILNADIAAKDGFAYSQTLTELEGGWDYEALNGFLLSPRKYAKGTKMSFAGLKKENDRAAVILYLRSLSDAPAELP